MRSLYNYFDVVIINQICMFKKPCNSQENSNLANPTLQVLYYTHYIPHIVHIYMYAELEIVTQIIKIYV